LIENKQHFSLRIKQKNLNFPTSAVKLVSLYKLSVDVLLYKNVPSLGLSQPLAIKVKEHCA
jgi:hypothetical protein